MMLVDRLSSTTDAEGRRHSDALRARRITKVFLTKSGDPVWALDDVTFSIASGEALAILGPSGCGKSTLLRILAGLDTDYAGELEFHGGGTARDKRRALSATVFQSDSTLPWMTVRKNVEFGLTSQRLGREEVRRRAKWFCEMVGLSKFLDAYPHELSGGMRQRAAVARALATEPQLLLLDEPLAALDAQTRLIMQEEFRRLWEETSATVVYITHDIEEALSLADRIIVLSAGPGRVCYERTNEPARVGEDLIKFRATSGFGVAAEELWDVLRVQIGTSLREESTEGE